MDLTRKILCFQAGCWDWKDIQADLETYLHRIAEKDIPDESNRSDFIDGMQNRLKTMAERFVSTGKDFEALVFSAVRFQLRTFKRNQARFHEFQVRAGRREWESKTSSSARNTSLRIPETDAASMHPDAVSFSGLPLPTRRTLLVAFRNPHVLDDARLLILARRFRLSFDWLFCIREEMKDRIFTKTCKSRMLQEKLEALQVAESCPSASGPLDAPQPGIRKSMIRLRKELKTIKPFPRHHELSECLNVPAGTISSSLFILRKNGMETD